jgi:serine/threonine-protein kinase
LLAARAQNYSAIRLSPDWRRAAVEIDGQIWLYDLPRDTLTRFTLEGDLNYNPVWSPDGKWIAFESAGNMVWQRADGSGGLERLTPSDYGGAPSSWSPDGQVLAFVLGADVWMLRVSDRKTWPFLHTQFNKKNPAFSPDGNWLAYISNESGRYEVYVQPYPGPGGKFQISTEGGTEPVWNPNGRELFYRSGNKIMAVKVTAKPGFAAGEPSVLFEGQYPSTTRGDQSPSYAVSQDGQHFLMHKQGEEATQINVVLNWFEELKRVVPSA